MNSPYWPKVSEVKHCIRTEAEELADATVLAVHEPMTFRRLAARETDTEMVGERALLDHVVQSNRPTPIIGESGFGKSHVIRWLHLQLLRRSRKDWHIVRIGKNASLRQALTTLLAGLEGPLFDDARKKIDLVGTELKTRQVAEHLVVFVGTRLAHLYEEAQRQVEQTKIAGGSSAHISAAQERRIKALRRHAKPGGMASLLSDPNFKAQFLGESGCFYQIANRLTKGSTSEEIESRPTQVRPEELVIEWNLGDLSLEARSYVKNAQLNTSEDMRTEAAALLNECLSDASRAAFQQLFQFSGSSFQDLFVAIRETLNAQGKTLFVLVEDMAAISAIEDVLIDSLMQEEIREGKQILCPLHSAIAVTTGYQGYMRRQATLSTRARYEWYIEKAGSSESDTLSRIEDFCGRYLNAARFGEEYLVNSFRTGKVEADWPGIWKSSDENFDHTAEVFGNSPRHYPLFPYSKLSIKALAKRYCQRGDLLEFNPRKILQHILQEPLKELREQYRYGEFPAEGFADVLCPGSLQAELRRGLQEHIERAETLAAIWGYGAQTIAELAHEMPAVIATEFGLPGLSKLLDASERRGPKVDLPAILASKGATEPAVSLPPTSQPADDVFAVSREVDEYLKKKAIPQGAANDIRKALVDAFDDRKDNLSDWYGIAEWPDIKQGHRTLIRIPFNSNNPPITKLDFGTDKDLQDAKRSLKYREFMVAVLRRKKADAADQQSWTYLGGEQDYYNYSNFLDEWIPYAAKVLLEEGRATAGKIIEGQIAAAAVFDPLIAKRTLQERMNTLVMTEESIRGKINFQTGLQEWDQFLETHIAEWVVKQKLWLDAYSTNRHALEGDVVIKALRRSSEIVIPAKAQRVAQTVAQVFAKESASLELLDGCTTGEDFSAELTNLREMVSRLSSTGQFKGMDGKVLARTYKDRIARAIESDTWEATRCALTLRQQFEPSAAMAALHKFNLETTKKILSILDTWQEFYAINRQRMLNENEEQGAGRRKVAEEALADLVKRLERVLTDSREQKHDAT